MPQTLFTLAYPEMQDADHALIEAFRFRHDLPFRDVVAAHFTLVFGTRALEREAFCAHVGAVAASASSFKFTCRYAMQGVDDRDDTGYVFLVPDEGHSSVARLHDRLYTGPLAQALRLDIAFVPHITIGTVPSHRAARDLCDALNRDGIEISGRIARITVASLRDGKVEDLTDFALCG